MGSPPPTGSKKVVLKFLSANSIVIPPARTGRESTSKNAVIKTDHTYKGRLENDIPGILMFIMVTIKLIAPPILLTPAKCKEKIAKSTEGPELAIAADRGG